MQVSTAMQALDSSGASILLALENSDANHLIASIKDHVDNLQVCIYVHTCVCTFIRAVFVHIRTYVYIHTYLRMYVCCYICTYVVYAVYLLMLKYNLSN